MRYGLIGINYKSASMQLREELTRAFDRLFGEQSLARHRYRTVLLSTCNRSELYFHSHDLSHQHSRFLHELRQVMDGDFEHALYSYFDDECLLHLSKVTAGLDSAFVGESEIQHQVKVAYRDACDLVLPSALHFLFQKSLHNGKLLRCEMPIEGGVPSLSSVVADHIVRRRLKKVLIVGKSKIGHQCCRALMRRNITDITLCTRHGDGMDVLPWEHIDEWVNYEAVIATSRVDAPVLHAKQADTQLILDLSVPRCSHPNVPVPVLNIDELGEDIKQRRFAKTELVQAGEKRVYEIVKRQLERREMQCVS